MNRWRLRVILRGFSNVCSPPASVNQALTHPFLSMWRSFFMDSAQTSDCSHRSGCLEPEPGASIIKRGLASGLNKMSRDGNVRSDLQEDSFRLGPGSAPPPPPLPPIGWPRRYARLSRGSLGTHCSDRTRSRFSSGLVSGLRVVHDRKPRERRNKMKNWSLRGSES